MILKKYFQFMFIIINTLLVILGFCYLFYLKPFISIDIIYDSLNFLPPIIDEELKEIPSLQSKNIHIHMILFSMSDIITLIMLISFFTYIEDLRARYRKKPDNPKTICETITLKIEKLKTQVENYLTKMDLQKNTKLNKTIEKKEDNFEINDILLSSLYENNALQMLLFFINSLITMILIFRYLRKIKEYVKFCKETH